MLEFPLGDFGRDDLQELGIVLVSEVCDNEAVDCKTLPKDVREALA